MRTLTVIAPVVVMFVAVLTGCTGPKKAESPSAS